MKLYLVLVLVIALCHKSNALCNLPDDLQYGNYCYQWHTTSNMKGKECKQVDPSAQLANFPYGSGALPMVAAAAWKKWGDKVLRGAIRIAPSANLRNCGILQAWQKYASKVYIWKVFNTPFCRSPLISSCQYKARDPCKTTTDYKQPCGTRRCSVSNTGHAVCT